MQPVPNPPAPATARLASLDAYRGLIMFTLLCGGIFHSLKGHPDWNWLFVQNEHVAWEGCVYWDLIQPSFMFMVGASMPFALARREALGDPWSRRLLHVLRRALTLVVVGILLDHFGADRVQIGFIRVLQQIAPGYVFSFFLVGRPLAVQGAVGAGVLVAYQLAWMFNPWNGPGGPWAMGGENLGTAFDRWMLGRNYSGHYVGLNAVPSGVTILLGAMAGEVLRRAESAAPALLPAARRRACATLVAAGVAGIACGALLGTVFPLVKRIWTPSFTVYAGGWTALVLGLFHGVVDVAGLRRWAFPLAVVGTNSLVAYVLGNSFGGWFRSLSSAWVAWLRTPLGPLWFPVFQHALFALSAWAVLWWLHRRRIFVKA